MKISSRLVLPPANEVPFSELYIPNAARTDATVPYSTERCEVRFPVEGVQGSLKTPGDVRAINLSRRGVAFETTHKLTVGDTYFLELRYRGQVVNVEIDLRWCSRSSPPTEDQPAVYRAGGPFVDVVRDVPDGLWGSLISGAAGDDPPV